MVAWWFKHTMQRQGAHRRRFFRPGQRSRLGTAILALATGLLCSDGVSEQSIDSPVVVGCAVVLCMCEFAASAKGKGTGRGRALGTRP